MFLNSFLQLPAHKPRTEKRAEPLLPKGSIEQRFQTASTKKEQDRSCQKAASNNAFRPPRQRKNKIALAKRRHRTTLSDHFDKERTRSLLPKGGIEQRFQPAPQIKKEPNRFLQPVGSSVNHKLLKLKQISLLPLQL
ncbi:hypothetical protein JCM6292_3489 [Bacteroides pyogenes JCM 6292]|uniref:Uncharacterized protein n=1 Tax=Bacteroides pyogenes JCM 6292 TaxID=1235809 RepID=W4PB69_9BACE|nr:hypothetical protein JCM6292_3489 [Bacteroides pyogenes JCM 6292]